jgi:hypothetical protein
MTEQETSHVEEELDEICGCAACLIREAMQRCAEDEISPAHMLHILGWAITVLFASVEGTDEELLIPQFLEGLLEHVGLEITQNEAGERSLVPSGPGEGEAVH